MKKAHSLAFGGLLMVLTACGGGGGGDASSTSEASSGETPSAAATPGTAQPDPGGKVIEVEMVTDLNAGGANLFRPTEVHASKGDVIRYKLVSGVHNVHFVADSNRTMTNPPPAGPMLQAPGQTWDVKVEWGPGEYYFQCDPHALLGMVGKVEVK